MKGKQLQTISTQDKIIAITDYSFPIPFSLPEAEVEFMVVTISCDTNSIRYHGKMESVVNGGFPIIRSTIWTVS